MMKMKRFLKILFCTILIFTTMTRKTDADIGPKPSVNIGFLNVDKTYYVTLLSADEVSGPYSAADPYDVSDDELTNRAVQIFKECAEKDDFYFLGNIQKIDPENPEYHWTYYPPKTFRIAVCDPQTGELMVSEVVEREAFNSYYDVSLSGNGLSVKEDIRLKNEVLGFLVRVVLTIVAELLLGLLFGYRQKKEILTIVWTNLFTQVLLNLIMAFLDYYTGALVWIFFLPILELAVLVIELIVYLAKFRSHSRFKTVIYAILANVLTFFLGMYLGAWTSVL